MIAVPEHDSTRMFAAPAVEPTRSPGARWRARSYFRSHVFRRPVGRRRWLFGALGLALCVGLSGCRSEPGNTTGSASSSASAAAMKPSAPADSASASASAVPRTAGTRLILLGTKGGPRVGPPGTATSTSTLLLVNGVPYIIDCGYGTSSQLVGAKVPLNTIRHVFITHHHSDHMIELGPLVYNGWATGLRSQVDVHGPPGTSKMLTDFLAYMQLDIQTRIADEGRPDLRKLVVSHEFAQPGIVFQSEDVKVTAARVPHPPIEQAYAYRFETKEASLVISGDTTYAPNLAEFAKDADVLVHEIMHLGGLEKLLKRVPNP
ncbi:MAG TPA: MBL fold metallo-hydrolase, partial [Polyangiaceae bacterium]|nr:MBL fold metallo-hydrolase [Polyangiaceae bacterium]